MMIWAATTIALVVVGVAALMNIYSIARGRTSRTACWRWTRW